MYIFLCEKWDKRKGKVMTVLLGIKLSDRQESSVEFQRIISDYGCHIGARLGLPPSSCDNWGIIVLEIFNKEIVPKLEKELLKIDNIEIQRMVFN